MIRPAKIPRAIYIDASVFITKMAPLPWTQSRRIEETSQIFEVSVQPYGRRVLDRAVVEISLAGAPIYELGYLFGYRTHKVRPVALVNIGEIVEVSVKLLPASHWWPRLKDAVWDYFQPPRMRVLLMGVVRKGEEN